MEYPIVTLKLMNGNEMHYSIIQSLIINSSKNKMKKILITGINGFLGSNLAKALSKEYHVIGLEYSLENLFRLKGYSFKVYSSNYDLEDIFRENKIFSIIHAATVYRRNYEPVENLIYTNILLPVRLYEFAKKYSVKCFLNTDSFFNNSKYDYKYLPEYTMSKKHALEWLKIIQSEVTLINMKLFHMYGPDDAQNKFIPYIISTLIENKPNIDLSPGGQSRDFIYIDDVVSAYLTVLKSQSFSSKNYLEFEIGTGHLTTIKEIVVIIKEISESQTKLSFGALPYREDEIMQSKAENSELLKLGWNPLHNLKTGIGYTISEYLKNKP